MVAHHHIAIRKEDQGAEWVVGVPQFHICAVSGEVDVERIKHQQCALVAGIYALHQPLMAKPAHFLEVW